MRSSSEIGRLVYEAVERLIYMARGSCRTFTPKQVAKAAGLDTKPVTLTVVRYFLEEMRKKGLIDLYRIRRGGQGNGSVYRYIITRESPLWKLVKSKTPKE